MVRPAARLIDKDEALIIGSLDRELLLKTAERVKVKVVEDE